MPQSRSTGEPWVHRRERRRHVAVRDQPDARAGRADLAHRVLVAGAVEHDHHHVAHRRRPSPCAISSSVSPQRAVEVEQVGEVARAWPSSACRRTAPGRTSCRARTARSWRSRCGRPLAHELGALERVDRDVHLGRRAVADPLAVVEHRRLVLLALADHHDAVHRDRVEHQPHGVHRRAVGAPPSRRGRSSGRRRARAYSVVRTSSMREVAVRARARWARGVGLCHATARPGGLRASRVARPGADSPPRRSADRAEQRRRSSRCRARCRSRRRPGRPRMIPLQRISTNAVIPTIIVTSPGRQVSSCPRAMIQARMNGAVQASASSESRMREGLPGVGAVAAAWPEPMLRVRVAPRWW